MTRHHVLALVAAAAVIARPARADDPAAALEHLKEGYALKQAGKCAEALPHFVESERLAPKPKTLLNLAECERVLGDLVSSQGHALDARDQTRDLGDAALLRIAERQLADVDKRLPRLTIRLAPGAPANTTVSRDGTALGRVSIGAPLPADPGKHHVVASSPGRAESGFDVVLTEGASQVLEVSPGELLPVPVAEPALPPPPAADAGPAAASSSWSGRKTLAATLAGAGVAGIAVGSVFGLEAIRQKNASNANGHCDPSGCDGTGTSLRNQAVSDATASTIAFGGGLAAVAAGVIVWLTAPATAPRVGATGHVEVAPVLGARGAGVTVLGAW